MFYQTFSHFSHLELYHIPQLASLDVFLLFFRFEYFYPFDHYAACWFTLIYTNTGKYYGTMEK